jgi:hypothetical protein
MRTIHLSFIVFLFVSNVSSAQQRDCKDCLAWSESRPLRWSDFKGNPKRSAQEEAMTDSGMSIELKCDGKTSKAVVKSYFNPHKSWTKDTKSVELLKHEQLHFDITELFVRKLRKQLSVLGNDCDKLSKHIQEFYDRNYKEFVAYQDAYDRESNHSINKEKQAFWERKVAKELADLKELAKD